MLTDCTPNSLTEIDFDRAEQLANEAVDEFVRLEAAERGIPADVAWFIADAVKYGISWFAVVLGRTAGG